MNISVRVESARAVAEIKKLKAEIANLERQLAAAGAAGSGRGGKGGIGSDEQIHRLRRFGNQLQWTGRQLELNFTLPILAAAAAGTKFALDNEKAFTRMKKVYGDTKMSMQQVTNETNALAKAMEALSNQFGIAQSDALNIAADWAQAGASGLALAKSVELTMKTMVLGEIDAAEATKALISIQAQYGLSTAGLAKTIETLNMVENQTGISMKGLIEGFERSAGTARAAGVDVQHLSALLAAMTPAAGSAAQAGNALKTILSRIMSPTNDAVEVMAKFGINVNEAGWQSLNGAKRLELLAEKFKTLTGGQKVAAAAVLGSRWQINRLGVALQDIGNYLDVVNGKVDKAAAGTSYYGTALESTSNAVANYKQAQKELNMVLSSNPQRLQIMWTILKNAMADVMQPLLPMIVSLAQEVAHLARAFADLDPNIQKMIMGFLLLFAAIGPVVRYFGTFVTLAGGARAVFSKLGAEIKGIGAAFASVEGRLGAWGPRLLKLVKSPWTAVAAAVIALVIIFRSQLEKLIGGLVDWVVAKFWQLPEGITGALVAVVDVVRQAALAVYEWFSYFNPWAHHSPSLVENVTTGMDAVLSQYARMNGAGALLAKATRQIQQFSAVSAKLGGGMFGDDRQAVAKGAASALPLFDQMVTTYRQLMGWVDKYNASIARQQAIVDSWKNKLDSANKSLKAQESILSGLESQLDKTQALIDGYQQSIQDYASAPIEGMQAFSDAIFANEMAQKQLQLQLINLGGTDALDNLKNSFAELNGDIEQLMGTMSDLRSRGAGSDILGPMQDQLDAMTSSRGSLQQQINNSPIQALLDQLDQLKTEADKLDLQQSLQFDPLTRQVDQLANGMKELPFAEIISGITQNKAKIDALQPTLKAQTDAVAKQKAIVDQMTDSRDRLQDSYDRENDVLQNLNDQMQKYADKANEVKDAISGLATAANAASSKAKNESPAAKAFDAAAQANYPDVGGKNSIGREGGPGDQSALIEQFTKDINDKVATMFGKFDIWSPIKKQFRRLIGWLKDQWNGFIGFFASGDYSNITKAWDNIVGYFKQKFSDLRSWWYSTGIPDLFSDLGEAASEVGDAIGDAWDSIADAFAQGKQAVGMNSKQWKSFKRTIDAIVDVISGGFILYLKALWLNLKLIGRFVAIVLVGAFRLLVSILKRVLPPVIRMLGKIIGGFIKIIAGLIQFVTGVLAGDWRRAWDGILLVVKGTFQAIWAIIKSSFQVIWGVVAGLVEGIVKFFVWLWDVLVGHSIIPDMVTSIIEWFVNLYDSVIQWVKDLVTDIVNWFKKLPVGTWNALKDLGSKLKDRAGTAFTAFWQKMKDVWTNTRNWIAKIPSSAWSALKDLSSKLWDRASTGFGAFWTKAKSVWTSIKTWISGLPSSAWSALKDLASKLAGRASDAFNAFKTTAKNMVDGKNGVMTWVKGIPGRIASALGSIGGTIANSIKGSWNTAAKWLNNNGIKNINKITEKIGFHMNSLPTFAKGGVVPGATSRTDNVLAGLRSGEGVLVPEAVKALGGRKGLERLNRAAERGQVFMEPEGRKKSDPHMGDGIGDKLKGMASQIGDWAKSGAGFALNKLLSPMPGLFAAAIPGDNLVEKVGVAFLRDVKNKIVSFGNTKDAQPGSQTLSHLGFMWQEKVLKAAFPGASVSSGFRPGAITSSGNLSYHALGRAIDIVPTDMKIFDWIWRNYGATSKELIYTPAGKRQLKDGRSHLYSGAVAADHYDHIHWAYDQGGYLKPGMGRYINRTGQPEPVFTSRQWSTLRAAINGSVGGGAGVLGAVAGAGSRGVGSGIVLRIARATVQIERLETDTVTRGSGGGDTFIFSGNLEFPNITSGADADEFVNNLKNLKGGR